MSTNAVFCSFVFDGLMGGNSVLWQEKLGFNSQSGQITAPFNNMRTLKFKAQPTNAFFATVNQIFGGSSQLPTTAERAVIKWLSTVQTIRQCSAVAGSWEGPQNV